MTAKLFPPEVLRGVEIAVASSRSEVLLGVREGVMRYFHQVLGRQVPVAVVPQRVDEVPHGLASSDEEMIERCDGRARELEDRLGDSYQFYLGVEEGLESVSRDGLPRHYVRTWAMLRGLGSCASGASGSYEIPPRLLDEGFHEPDGRRTLAGLRRQKGLVAALSGGVDSRRAAVATAVFNAIASLFFEFYSGHPRSAR